MYASTQMAAQRTGVTYLLAQMEEHEMIAVRNPHSDRKH
jgi:hypothetical protein